MNASRMRVHMDGRVAYEVRVESGCLSQLGTHLREYNESRHAVIITDSNVGPLLLDTARDSLVTAGYVVDDLSVDAGEQSKALAVAGELWDALALLKVDRDDIIVALGGGVVGDLAGFVASTYLRGIACAQVPTSLLAMVDSSVGGKTAIDISAGKNLVGTFSQPVYVMADTAVLETLPAREWACGLAEVAKSAVLDGGVFHSWLEDNAHNLASRDADAVAEAIVSSVGFKAGIVGKDEHEKGMRACLNYGHTLGHAIETLAGFGTFSHGAAVAEGMRFSARLAAALIQTPTQFVFDQDALLDVLGLPALNWTAAPEDLLECMHGDKKVRAGRIRFVLPEGPGKWRVEAVDDEVVLEHLRAWVRSKEGMEDD